MSYLGLNDATGSLSHHLRNLIEAIERCKQDPILMAQIHENLRDEENIYHFCDMIYKMNMKRPSYLWDKKLTDYFVDNDSLELYSMGWNHSGGYYRFKNRCMDENRTYNCKELRHHCSRQLDNEEKKESVKTNPFIAMNDLSKIFLDKKCGWVFSYLFSYALTSLFASLLLKINPTRNIPFYLQIAVGNNANVDTLIREIWRICDVTVGIEIMDCICENKEKHHCTDVPQIFSPALDLTHDILLLKRNSDVPVIINARMKDDKSYYTNLIKQFSAADFRKVTTMPIFVTNELIMGYERFINIDLSELEIEEDYLALIAANKGLLSALVYTFIENCTKNNDCEIKYRKNPIYGNLNVANLTRPIHGDVYNNLPRLLNNYALDMKTQFYEGISDNDIICVFYLTTFFGYFITSFNDRVNGSESDKETFKKVIDGFRDDVSAIIFKTHKAYSPNSVRDILMPKDMDYKKEREVRQLISKLDDECAALKIFYNKNTCEIKDDKLIVGITLQKGTKKEALNHNSNDIGHRIGKLVKISERGNDIRIVLSEQKKTIINLPNMFERVTEKNIEGKKIPFILGEDEFGEPYVTDLAEIPHLLIGGATNSGKSVALRALIANVIHYTNPDNTKLILIDLFSNRFSHTFGVFAESNHLGYHLVTDYDEALHVLHELNLKIENWKGINACRIICVIDEFDVLFRSGKAAEELLSELLQRARKVDVHFILATQGATKKKIKIDKDNLSAKMAFQCSHVYQSLAIIGNGNARFLYGKGDMIFSSQHNEFFRIQGAFIDDDMIKKIVEPTKTDDIEYVIPTPKMEVSGQTNRSFVGKKQEEALFKAVCFAFKEKKCSIKALKAHLRIGFDKADALMKRLGDLNIIDMTNVTQGRHAESILPLSYENLQDEVKALLEKHGMSKDEVQAILKCHTESIDEAYTDNDVFETDYSVVE